MSKELEEALERLKTAPTFMGGNSRYKGTTQSSELYLLDIGIIENALLKTQELEKALKIIKEKYVHIPQLLCAFENQLEEENPLEVYYNGQVGINVPMPLTQEEFNLLKEVLCDE